MKAIILAAGQGSRMLPHTEHRPKCLIKVGGHSILDYQVAALRSCGIREIVIVVGYLGARIREHVDAFVDGPVTFVENAEYGSTNSSYSLWLARAHMADGFLYLNSDLVFDPGLLRALLDGPDENAVIVDRQVRPASDMLKAQMDGTRILRMSKDLATDVAAEVVGPVKFGASGARQVVARLDELIAAGERNRWAYEVFGGLSERIRFAGVDNPGRFWAEVDTPGEALEANQKVPRELREFVDRRQAAAGADRISPVDGPRHDPMSHLDQLLNARFAALLEPIAGAEARVGEVLERNRAEFGRKVAALGLSEPSAADIHEALQRAIVRIDDGLDRRYGRAAAFSARGLDEVIADVLARLPASARRRFCLTERAAVGLLELDPPRAMIDALGYGSTSALVQAEGPLTVLTLTRITEDAVWQERYKSRVASLTAAAFEERPVAHVAIDSSRYRSAFMNSKQPPKLWRVTHSKEAGLIATLTPDDPLRFQTPLLQYVLAVLHYVYETMYASRSYTQAAAVDPAGLGRHVARTIDSREARLTFFYTNVYAGNLYWDNAIRTFAGLFPSDEASWFSDASARGEFCESAAVQPVVAALNLIDQLWNLNFLGAGGIGAGGSDGMSFLYHFRGALWQEAIGAVTGLGDRLEPFVVDSLGDGDLTMTQRLLGNLRIGNL